MRIKVNACKNCPFCQDAICGLAAKLGQEKFIWTEWDNPTLYDMPDWCPLRREEYILFTEETDSEKDIPEEFKKKMEELQNQVSSLEDLGSKLKELYKDLE